MSKKVLLADDSVTIQKVVKIILATGDYDLQVADNGDAALAKALADRPDIVLADVYMPGKNGYELCAAIKQTPSLAGVPVVLLSGTFEAFDESKAREAGADGSIAKPFESQMLLDQLQETLESAASTAADQGAISTGYSQQDTAAAEPDMWTDLGGGDEVDLEVDDLWDDESLADSTAEPLEFVTETNAQEPDLDFDDVEQLGSTANVLSPPAPVAESEEEILESEEEILFLDEDDLLIEDDTDVDLAGEEQTFEFITSDDASPEEPMTGLETEFTKDLSDTDQMAEVNELDSEVGEVSESGEWDWEETSVEETLSGTDSEEPADLAAEDAETLQSEEETAAEPTPDPAPAPSFFGYDLQDSEVAGDLEEEPMSAGEAAAAEVEPSLAVVDDEAVAERVQGLSEEQLTAIVERVAGKVVERLAATVLERIAWEVVPDLAESLIREEISRITNAQD